MQWTVTRNTDTQRLNLKFFASQIQIPLPNRYLGVGYKGLVFCRNNGWLMENMRMDKGLTVPKWVLINWQKITQMRKNLSAQIFYPSPKVWVFWWKKAHWASVIRDSAQTYDGKICNENPKMATCCTLETQWAICHQIFSFSWNKFERNFFIFTKYIHLKVSKFSLLTTYKKKLQFFLESQKSFLVF